MQSWFRFYDDAISDPKVQLLSDNLFKFWINILCLANKNNGTLPDMHHLAYALHETEGSVSGRFKALVEAGLIEKVNATTWAPHNWNGRQFKSDTSTPRVKRFRQRSKQRYRNGSGNVSETPTEREKERENKERNYAPYGASNSFPSDKQARSLAGAPDGALAHSPSLELQLAKKQHLGISPDPGMDYRSPPRAKSDNKLEPLPERSNADRSNFKTTPQDDPQNPQNTLDEIIDQIHHRAKA